MNTKQPSDGVLPSIEEMADWLYDTYGWPVDEAREFARLAVDVYIRRPADPTRTGRNPHLVESTHAFGGDPQKCLSIYVDHVERVIIRTQNDPEGEAEDVAQLCLAAVSATWKDDRPFSTGTPRAPHGSRFEVLVEGENPPEVRRATLDLSTQNRAEGIRWVVQGLGPLPGHRIKYWRPI